MAIQVDPIPSQVDERIKNVIGFSAGTVPRAQVPPVTDGRPLAGTYGTLTTYLSGAYGYVSDKVPADHPRDKDLTETFTYVALDPQTLQPVAQELLITVYAGIK